jgi:hypothetical protein
VCLSALLLLSTSAPSNPQIPIFSSISQHECTTNFVRWWIAMRCIENDSFLPVKGRQSQQDVQFVSCRCRSFILTQWAENGHIILGHRQVALALQWPCLHPSQRLLSCGALLWPKLCCTSICIPHHFLRRYATLSAYESSNFDLLSQLQALQRWCYTLALYSAPGYIRIVIAISLLDIHWLDNFDCDT